MNIFERIRSQSEGERFAAGELLFRAGETGSLLYVVAEGEVALERAGDSPRRVGTGGVVGEEAIAGGVRATTARALTDTRVVPVSRAGLVFWSRHADELGAERERVRAERARRSRAAVASVLFLAASAANAQLWEVGNRLLVSPWGAQAGALFGSEVAVGDFDGDGYDDLAVGEWAFESNLGDVAGSVSIWRGSAAGLGATKWTSLLGQAAGDAFGVTLAAADFDGDGRDELAVGATGRDVFDGSFTRQNAGAVSVYGWEGGVWSLGATFTQATPGIYDAPEQADEFGGELAAGDFDGDGYADLAIAASWEDLGAVAEAGVVHVVYGSASGLAGAGSQIWSLSGLGETAAAQDQLGDTMAAGDFDGDGYDELALAATLRQVDGVDYVGTVYVLFGTASGISPAGLQAIDPTDVGGSTADGWFGTALAAGDFNFSYGCGIGGYCADDLAIGAPRANVGAPNSELEDAGALFVVPGSHLYGRLLPEDATRLTQASLENATPVEQDDQFGYALASGYLDRRPGAELVVGAVQESFFGATSAGAAHVLLSGGGSGLQTTGDQLLWQKSGYLSAPATSGDHFGSALAIGDFDGDGTGDLAVGIPLRNGNGLGDAGAVQVLYGALFADGFESTTLAQWSNH
jgi:hypothetical protein